jgi:hypothetical protein
LAPTGCHRSGRCDRRACLIQRSPHVCVRAA